MEHDKRWVRSSRRMPTERDADEHGNVRWWERPRTGPDVGVSRCIVACYNPEYWEGAYIDDIRRLIMNYPYWMPTSGDEPGPPDGL